MQTYREALTANQPLQLAIQGRTLFITRCPMGPLLTVEFVSRQAESGRLKYVGKGLQATPLNGFEGIKITSPVDGEIDFVITEGGFDLKFNEDATIIGNDDAASIPVKTAAAQSLQVKTKAGDWVDVRTDPAHPLDVLFAGTVEPVLGVVTVDNAPGEEIPVMPYMASAVTNAAPAAVADVADALVAANTARRGLRLRNVGANPVAIGGAGIAYANAAVIIQPGETWNENEAPGAAWYAVCGAGLASTLNIQTIA